MLKLLNKEMKLSSSVLSYIYIVFALMAFLPGYPILVGSFLCCLGMFQTFQAAREANDITYTALLPVAKGDVVKARYVFCIFIEALFFGITTVATFIRMAFFANTPVYTHNALMPANFIYLAFVLLIFGCFNFFFIGGFFKTAYKFGKLFVYFIIISFIIIGIGETLFHIPGLHVLGTLGFGNLTLQISILGIGILAFILLTFFSLGKAIDDFERIDL